MGNKFLCPDCSFVYYHNTAAASGCVLETPKGILLLERGREPSLGKLDLPGGFIDPGEGILEGLCRELREELGWEPDIPKGVPLEEIFTLFASFPNTYPYKNVLYNTCDMFFTLHVPDLTEKDFRLEAGEVSGLCFVSPEKINIDTLAFDSTRRAILAFRDHVRRRA